MGKRDPRVDAYIDKSAPFAHPVLRHIRDVVHEACPEVEEKIKWGAPFFDYKGMLCSMAAFKQHCSFGFWKGSLVLENARDADAAGQFGRIEKVSDLPSRKILTGYIRKAMKLNDEGIKASTRKTKTEARPAIEMPDYFRAALDRNKKAKAVFDAFSPSHRREYLEWITEAKTEETRERRMKTAIEWMSEGKQRNWKYQR